VASFIDTARRHAIVHIKSVSQAIVMPRKALAVIASDSVFPAIYPQLVVRKFAGKTQDIVLLNGDNHRI